MVMDISGNKNTFNTGHRLEVGIWQLVVGYFFNIAFLVHFNFPSENVGGRVVTNGNEDAVDRDCPFMLIIFQSR